MVGLGFYQEALAFEFCDSSAGGFGGDAQHCAYILSGEQLAFTVLGVVHQT